jgi:hypothetical protein
MVTDSEQRTLELLDIVRDRCATVSAYIVDDANYPADAENNRPSLISARANLRMALKTLLKDLDTPAQYQ